MLTGTEVRSVRLGNIQFADSFCYFKDGDLFLKDLYIAPYSHGNIHNPDPRRERKLLLKKKELMRLKSRSEEKGLTIIPSRIFFNERNYCKVEIALAKGKKLYDKRESIKERESKRKLQQGED
jgi:SsrA-binding protein